MIQRFKSNQDGNFEVDLINEEDEDFVTEPYTLVPPPVPNWKPVFDFTENKWIETLSDDEIKVKNAGASSLEELKENKKKQLSQTCKEDILSGFKAKVEDKLYHFSYSLSSQANLSERLSLFQNDIIMELKITAYDIEAEEEKRIVVTKEDFKNIYVASVKAKEDKIAKLKDILIPRVAQAQSIDEVNLVNWGDISVVPGDPSIGLKQDNMIDKRVEETSGGITELTKEVAMSNEALLEMAFNLI